MPKDGTVHELTSNVRHLHLFLSVLELLWLCTLDSGLTHTLQTRV